VTAGKIGFDRRGDGGRELASFGAGTLTSEMGSIGAVVAGIARHVVVRMRSAHRPLPTAGARGASYAEDNPQLASFGAILIRTSPENGFDRRLDGHPFERSIIPTREHKLENGFDRRDDRIEKRVRSAPTRAD